MDNFLEFYMPTRVIIGDNALLKNSSHMKKYGKKALIVTGLNSSKVNGSLDDVILALENENIKYKIMDNVDDNPTIELVQDTYDQNSEEKIDFIIGLGGGAAIDAAKAIGVLFRNKGISAKEAFNLKNLKSIPIIAIPTTSGTGSEVTQYSIISSKETRLKKDLGQESFPKVAYLDARYTYYESPQTSVNMAFDAFSHLIEGYLNKKATYFTDVLAERGLNLFSQCKEALLKGEFSHEDREKLMMISNLGGIIISQNGTTLPHALGYVLTNEKKLPHGAATVAMYNGYFDLIKNDTKFKKVLDILGFETSSQLMDFIYNSIDFKLNISENEAISFTTSMLNNIHKIKNHPSNVRKEDILHMYTLASRD